jgi:hypothetical protein
MIDLQATLNYLTSSKKSQLHHNTSIHMLKVYPNSKPCVSSQVIPMSYKTSIAIIYRVSNLDPLNHNPIHDQALINCEAAPPYAPQTPMHNAPATHSAPALAVPDTAPADHTAAEDTPGWYFQSADTPNQVQELGSHTPVAAAAAAGNPPPEDAAAAAPRYQETA